ncbi:uncharacterized protein LOC121960309 [Plectropomus leopardus]|uniref:uncharacterized protein LOC121960309 n=1 Tax=Plectropomus leopardus TaxID=160734 RepID=UPI001C4C8886|nr:uncharacterized protein LOC121960309 [Plectropomus leopardus]
MAQFDCTDENCWSSSILTTLHSYFGDPVNNLISRIQDMTTRDQLSSEFSCLENNAEDTGGLDGSSGSLNEPEDCSPPTDISSALRSVALMRTLDLKKMHCLSVPKLFPVPQPEEDSPTLSPVEDQDESTEGAADPAEEEVISFTFQSKYIDFFPLYQDYCLQEIRDDLHRLSKSFVSELIAPQYLQGLQSRLVAQCGSEAASPQLNSPEVPPSSPPPHPVRVIPSTLWQDLVEVKASGLLRSLTNREIRLQEVWKALSLHALHFIIINTLHSVTELLLFTFSKTSSQCHLALVFELPE